MTGFCHDWDSNPGFHGCERSARKLSSSNIKLMDTLGQVIRYAYIPNLRMAFLADILRSDRSRMKPSLDSSEATDSPSTKEILEGKDTTPGVKF